ncbi:MAG: hypothetical protein LRS45_04000 [Desulfurococcales archaeon]|nr:hypothetical protein [Desulfurococcales archaeon]
MGYKLGLTISVIIGFLIASFPLYADTLSSHLWNMSLNEYSEESRGTHSMHGTIEKVDLENSEITVNGIVIKVVGTWTAPNGSVIESSDLLQALSPGDSVIVKYSKRGRWGYMLDEITVERTGEHYVKST